MPCLSLLLCYERGSWTEKLLHLLYLLAVSGEISFFIVGFLQPKTFAIWSIKSHYKSNAWLVLHLIQEI